LTIERQELENYLNKLLSPQLFTDYGPNGLQIEGTSSIKKIAFAVSATAESVATAVEKKADTLIVHHGLFWRFHGPKTLTGSFARRVMPLARHDINLFGFHLPLDAHMTVGNAATIAKKIELYPLEPFGDYKGSPLGVKGNFARAIKASELQQKLEKILGHTVLLASPNEDQTISSMGIITGGANSEWELARREGLDSYLTGEMSEHDWHESKEAGIHMFAGGHNATESFGVQALMETISQEFNCECFYIPSSNPA
jgi:dinuclear metal center YbgI/SA1388 family protein